MAYTTLISADELAQSYHSPDWVVIDCRFELSDTSAGRRAYAAGHIPGARYAHLDEDLSGPILPGQTGRHPLPDPAALMSRLGAWGIDASKQVVVYDAQGGGVAARLWWMLRWLGHDAVAVLDGGWPAWSTAQYPQSQEVPTPQACTFVGQPKMHWIADAAAVDALRQDARFALIDVRAPERYRGEVEPIDPIAGHIGGAINAPFAANMEQGRFKSPEALREHYQQLSGHKPSEQVVFYCGSGVTACHGILAWAHAGLGDARLYPGSWSEWITDESRL